MHPLDFFQRQFSPSDTLIHSAIARSASYLTATVLPDGRFEYRINMDATVYVKPKYNILRHAGALYAMATYYQQYGDAKILPAILRAGQYFREDAIAPIAELPNMLAVWSKPEVNGSSSPLQVKLGGVGLGLVALLSIEDTQPGFTPLADLRSLGQFVVYMQKEDGSFYSKYIPSQGGRQDRWQSLYYSGEAALGLLKLYQKDPDPIWLEAAANALGYLVYSREGAQDVPADHWALLATEALFSLGENLALPVSRPLLVSHASQICTRILQDQMSCPSQPRYDGGFTTDGRTTPTATRLEGLLAALSFLPEDSNLRQPICIAVNRGVRFLLQAQITVGDFAGAMPRAVGTLQGNGAKTLKFNRRATEIRIDYIQHAMSALMQSHKTFWDDSIANQSVRPVT